MAISQFENNKEYKLNTDKIRDEQYEATFWSQERILYATRIELNMNIGTFSNSAMTFDNAYFRTVFKQESSNNYIQIDVFSSKDTSVPSLTQMLLFKDVQNINFVFGIKDGQTVDNFMLDYVNLIKDKKRALVSIYDHLSTKENKWVSLPCPSDYSGGASTLVDSGRNTQGQVVGSVIASDVAKIELKWNFLTVAEYSKIAKLFEPAYYGGDTSVFMRACSFFDVIKGSWNGSVDTAPDIYNNHCKVFYPGDRKVSFAKMVLNENGTPKGYSGVSLNLIDTGKYYGE